jgi:O-antigen ligase
MLAVVTIPLAIWPGGSWAHVSGPYFNAFLLFVLISYGVRSLADVGAVVWGLFGAALLLEIGQLLSERTAFGLTYDANDVAFVMICLLPIAGSYFAAADGGARWIAGVAAVLAVGTIVLTRSRGGFVSLCVIGLVLLFRMPARRQSLRFLLVIGAVVIFACFASADYWKRIATIWTNDPDAAPEAYDEGGLAVARLTIWETGLDLFTQHPVLGVGAGGFQVAEGLSHGGGGKWNAAHNSFLQIAVELGIVGFVLFVAQLRRGIRDCRELTRKARDRLDLQRWLWLAQGIEISLYAYIVSGIALSQGYSYVLYLLLGITAVIHRVMYAAVEVEAEPR